MKIIPRKLIGITVLLFGVLSARAQLVLNTPINNGTYTAPYDILLDSGFYSAPTSGQAFAAYIVFNECLTLGTKLDSTRNWIVTYTPRDSAIIYPADTGLTICKEMVGIQFMDGLGRPIQTVQVRGTPFGYDLVQAQAYDKFGRESTKYLPYKATTHDGSYKTDATTFGAGVYTYYTSGDAVNTAYPFAQTIYELSAEGRPTEQGAPGAAWQLSNSGVSGSGHTIRTAYGAGGSDIPLWTVATNGNGASTSGNYYSDSSTGTLQADTVTDENNHSTVTFTDIDGHVIAKEVQVGASTWLRTDYIYDDFGNLSYVIPPLPAGVTYPGSFTESSTVFNQYLYGYHYDGRRRVISKKIPGKGWEYLVYNNLDKLVASQDSVLQTKKQWIFTKYDAHGRMEMTGIWDNGNVAITRGSLQASVNTYTKLWDTTVTTGTGYSADAWPTSNIVRVLTLNYYDNYSFPNKPSGYTPTASGAITKPTGLLTATKTDVMLPDGTYGSMLWTVNYYDDKGRVIQTYAQHYLGGESAVSTNNYDNVVSTYDFSNEVVKTVRQHYKNVSGTATLALTLTDTSTYDHMGRKQQTWVKVNSGTNVMTSQNSYNELGQLKDKGLHSTDGGGSFLQDITYTYNERGWLKTAGSPLFAMQLKYNDGTTPQYNGNIANQLWGTPGSLNKSYTYSYDYLNRLTSGVASTGNTEKSITYDNLGNIKSLQRYLNNTEVDALGYSYSGNQLSSLTDSTSSDAGYKHGTFTYVYDGNGNMITDNSKGLSTTYNIMDLPATNTLASGAVKYTYDADGKKLRKVVTIGTGDSTEYISGIQYSNGTIDFIQTDEGRILLRGGVYNYEYNLPDQLGNVRYSFDTHTGGVTTVQQDDYLPFGYEVSIGSIVAPKNEYLYNRKELQEELGIYDFGARSLDPLTGRWKSVDPLAEKSRRWSVYNYVENNPIRFTDPDGMIPPDDYYSRNGQYLGSDNAPTNNIRVIKKDDYNSIVNGSKGSGTDPTAQLQANSKLVTVPTVDEQAAYMANLYTTGNAGGNGDGKEINVPIVLNPDQGTLGFGTPQTNGNNSTVALNYDQTPNGTAYAPGHDPGSGDAQVIVGVVHDHPEPPAGRTLVSGVSTTPNPNGGCDLCTAKAIGAPVYAIDKSNVHKVDQNGNVKNNLPRNQEVVRDALETKGGRH